MSASAMDSRRGTPVHRIPTAASGHTIASIPLQGVVGPPQGAVTDSGRRTPDVQTDARPDHDG